MTAAVTMDDDSLGERPGLSGKVTHRGSWCCSVSSSENNWKQAESLTGRGFWRPEDYFIQPLWYPFVHGVESFPSIRLVSALDEVLLCAGCVRHCWGFATILSSVVLVTTKKLVKRSRNGKGWSEYVILQNLRYGDDAKSLCELSRIARPCRRCSLSESFAVRADALCELMRCANDQRVLPSVCGFAWRILSLCDWWWFGATAHLIRKASGVHGESFRGVGLCLGSRIATWVRYARDPKSDTYSDLIRKASWVGALCE
ncbi:hypothetical protein LR48_Vigan08g125200 [Vigna angularis]|uniref:Uncharacterized protein n=1 Tax=Phaseolus angularis TaxID=3914 RepID=A0A0L9V5T9_PHAAN|nr:hypothetical protein LR48_Vigan08g125200 [Vigna angularis]